MNEISLYAFPDKKESSFDFYEDDGTSLEYRKGSYSVSHITLKAIDDESILEIGGANGGKIANRQWNIIMHVENKPVSVRCNEKLIPDEKYFWDESRKELTISGIIAPAIVKVKR